MKKEDIEHLARLARIELSSPEADRLASDITSIVQYVSDINEITADQSTQKTIGALSNVMREDRDPHEPGMYTEDLLRAAPERDGQYIKVKKILGDKE